MNTKSSICNLILIILIILENYYLLITPVIGKFDQTVNATCFFLSSFLFGFVLLYKFYKKPVLISKPSAPFKYSKYAIFLIFAVEFIFINTKANEIFKLYPGGVFSDIIPTIKVLCHRLLTHQYPYSTDALISLYYHTPSGYLPAHWLPYTVAEYFHFAYQTITIALWCISAIVVMLRVSQIKSFLIQVVVSILLTGSYYLICLQIPTIVGATVETMVAAYYMLFIFGLNKNNALVTGFFIACCLLSRYYVVVWLPLWGATLYISNNKKELYSVSLFILFFIMILYVIPFLSKDWSSFYAAHVNNYEDIPIGAWRQYNPDGLPWHLYTGTGFAHLFYQHYLHSNIQDGYDLLKKVLIGSLIVSQLLLGIFFWWNKTRINYKIFLMASFKIFLSLFLAFIMIPYSYLMVTSIFVSIAIFVEQVRYQYE